MEGLIGFFVNTLVMRANLAGDPSFRELLKRVRETCIEAYAHQDLPFEKLVEELQPERNLSHAAMFQVMFALQRKPLANAEFGGLSLTPVELETATAKFDLVILIEDSEPGLIASVEYSSELFDESTIARLQAHYEKLLAEILADPEQRIWALPLLSADEQRQFAKWNCTEAAYPEEKCIHEMFEEQAERTPEGLAVDYAGQQLSYGELNRRANQLAHYLRTLGVGPDVLVGICVERSLDMVVGLLGILKAGGAYVPLDPEYPRERLRYMLEDAKAPVLLAQQQFRALLVDTKARVVCLDSAWDKAVRSSTENQKPAVGPDNLAYVIYTSGSTGNPKGVMIQQRSVANLIAWHQRVYKISPTDRATQVSALAFDAAVWEIWPYLVSGASVWIANPETRLSPVKLLKWLRNTNITLCFLPTPLAEVVFTSLVNEGQDGFALRALLTGGDRLSRSPERPLPFELLNHYGPTEATVVATRTLVASGGRGGPPIGKPIDNSQVVILDRNLQLTPVGVPGELCIGGVGLARGYFARPSLTADKFIPNPFSSKAGARLYRTGDLARYLPDGNLEYLGRIDQQVKIRATVSSWARSSRCSTSIHPCVHQPWWCAKGRANTSGSQAIWWHARTPPPCWRTASVSQTEAAGLHGSGNFRMAQAVTHDTQRKSGSECADRSRRPTSGSIGASLAPRTQLEELLTNVWGEILCLEKIGIHDNFFELGGHSLLATRVISRLHSILPVDVSVRSLFETPTVANLAQKMEWAMGRKQLSGCAQPMRRALRIHSLRLSYAQQRLWFLDQLQPGSSVYNIATALQVEGRLDLERLRRSLEEIMRRHEVLRTRVVVREGEPVQEITAAQGLALAVVDLRALPEEEREARPGN